MADFPLLSTGAITQYPLGVSVGQPTQVIRFLDGSDQRYRGRGRMLRRWHIKLSLLNETEVQQLEAFFISQLGDYMPFSFPDPVSGTSVPNCRFGDAAMLSEYLATDVEATAFWVVETNG